LHFLIRSGEDENQKDDAAHSERLKGEGRAAEQDGEEAKDLKEAGH
jgi:hypothetical protein